MPDLALFPASVGEGPHFLVDVKLAYERDYMSCYNMVAIRMWNHTFKSRPK